MTQAFRHKIPLPFQLVLALGWYFLLFIISSAENDTSALDQLLDDAGTINFLKISQALAVFFVFILPVLLFALFAREEKLGFLKLNKNPGFHSWLIALFICLASLPAVSLLQSWNAGMHFPESFSGIETWMKAKEDAASAITKAFLEDRSIASLLLNLFVIAIMAALSEELFFRGLIQRLFMENKINLHVAVWITAALFSAFHLQFFGFLPRLYLGALLGYLYAYSNNLWVPFIAHFMNNAFAVLVSFIWGFDPEEAMPDTYSQHLLIPIGIFSIVIGVFMIYFLKRRSYQEKKSITVLDEDKNADLID